jgi:hypothetical protein
MVFFQKIFKHTLSDYTFPISTTSSVVAPLAMTTVHSFKVRKCAHACALIIPTSQVKHRKTIDNSALLRVSALTKEARI